MNQNLDVSINGISEYLRICLGTQSFGRDKLRELFNLALCLLLDLFGEFRASKNIEMVQYMAQITIGICNNLSGGQTSSTLVDEVVTSLAFPNQSDSSRLTSNATGKAQPGTEMMKTSPLMSVKSDPAASAEAGDQNKTSSYNQKDQQKKKVPLSTEQVQFNERPKQLKALMKSSSQFRKFISKAVV